MPPGPTNDRLLRAMRREPVDVTPVWFMRQAGRFLPGYRTIRERYSLAEMFRRADIITHVVLLPVQTLDVDAAILFADITLPLIGMGVRFEFRENVGPVMERRVEDDADVRTLRLFEPEAHVPAVLEAIAILRRELDVPLIGFAGAPFTLASYLVEGGPSRDFGRTKAMMFHEPATWSRLMDTLTTATIEYLRAQVGAGVQAIQLFDSWVGTLAPADYTSFVLPYSARIFQALASLGVPAIHFGTGTAGLLTLMAEAGGEVIGIDWRIALDDAWARLGFRTGIQGNLDPMVALGPPGLVRERTEEVLRRAGGRPGHIFNLGHGVLPETSPDTLRALVEIVHAFRLEEVRT